MEDPLFELYFGDGWLSLYIRGTVEFDISIWAIIAIAVVAGLRALYKRGKNQVKVQPILGVVQPPKDLW